MANAPEKHRVVLIMEVHVSVPREEDETEEEYDDRTRELLLQQWSPTLDFLEALGCIDEKALLIPPNQIVVEGNPKQIAKMRGAPGVRQVESYGSMEMEDGQPKGFTVSIVDIGGPPLANELIGKESRKISKWGKHFYYVE